MLCIQWPLIGAFLLTAVLGTVASPNASRGPRCRLDGTGTPTGAPWATLKEAIVDRDLESVRRFKAEGQQVTFRLIQDALYRRSPALLRALVEDVDLGQELLSECNSVTLIREAASLDRGATPPNMPLTRILLKRGAVPTTKDIFHFIYVNSYESVQLLLTRYTGQIDNDPACYSVLDGAIEQDKDPRILEALLRAGMNPNQEARSFRSLLAQTVANGDYEKSRVLLAAGADPNRGPSAIEEALKHLDRVDLVHLLVRYGAIVSDKTRKALPEQKRRWLDALQWAGRYSALVGLVDLQVLPLELVDTIFSNLF